MENKRGRELKVLSYMLNHKEKIPEIASQLNADSFSDNNRELFTKISEIGSNGTTDLVNDLCKLKIRNWRRDNLEHLLKVDGDFSNLKIDTAIASLTNKNNGHIKLVSAKELQNMEIKPITWTIENLLCEGLIVCAGRPKIGKSFLALNMSLAIANGGHALGYFKANKNSVLYIPYEDNYRRLQERINKMLSEERINDAPSNLFIPKDCDFPKLTKEGIAQLENILNSNLDIKLVVIDTLGRAIVRSNKRNTNQFQDEYDFGASLQKIALQRHISILLIHHTTKMKYEDGYDSILGTTGLTASPDSLMLLSKDMNKDFVLSITGRDIEEKEYAVKFQNCLWKVEGEKSKILTPEREEIFSLFKQYERPLKTKEIAECLGKKESNISQMLGKMVKDGILTNEKYGEYVIKV